MPQARQPEMNAPDWRSFALEPHIRAAPNPDGSRLVLWLPTERDDHFQYWERIANVTRAPVSAEAAERVYRAVIDALCDFP